MGKFQETRCCGFTCMTDIFPVLQFQYANFASKDYVKTGKGSLTFRLIKQRADFAFGFFSGNLSNVNYAEHANFYSLRCRDEIVFYHEHLHLFCFLQPVLLAISNTVAFADLKAPVWPRLAMGKSWNEVLVLTLIATWLTILTLYS